VQRIGRAFPPFKSSREDWRILLDLAGKLGVALDWRTPEQIFLALTQAVPAFAGMTYKTIGAQGANIAAVKA